MPFVEEREINNFQTHVHATGDGTWRIYEASDDRSRPGPLLGTGDSLDKAVTKARNEIKKKQVKVEVQFLTMDGKRGVITDKHARSRDTLLGTIAGKKESISTYQKALKPDTPKDVVEHLNDINVEVKRLENERKAILKEWELSLGNAYVNAVVDAVKEAVAKEENKS